MINSSYSTHDKRLKNSKSFDESISLKQSVCDESERISKHSKESKSKKNLEDLNLMDSFLFNASTEKIHDAEVIARIVVERTTGQKLGKVIIQTEKQLKGIDTDGRGVRLDLFITKLDKGKVARVYDIEPNNYDFDVLPRRDRYNQALSDVKLLDAGTDFRELPEYISIWILPYDPFGDNRMIYTVKNVVTENQTIVYNDGVKRLFLNAKGQIGGTKKLKALLNYFLESSDKNATDPELLELHNIVTGIKHNREVGERYMTFVTWEQFAQMKIDSAVYRAKREVTEQVTSAAIASFIRASVKVGATKEDIIKGLTEEYSLTEEKANERIREVCGDVQ